MGSVASFMGGYLVKKLIVVCGYFHATLGCVWPLIFASVNVPGNMDIWDYVEDLQFFADPDYSGPLEEENDAVHED